MVEHGATDRKAGLYILHHSLINLIITLPINKLSSQHGIYKQKRTKYSFHSASVEELQSYNEEIIKRFDIVSLTQKLNNGDSLSDSELNQIYKQFSKSVKKSARQFIPSKIYNKSSGIFQTKQGVSQKFIKTLRYLKLARSNNPTNALTLLIKIQKIYRFWIKEQVSRSNEPFTEIEDYPPLSVMSSFIRKSINGTIGVHKI